MQRNFASHWIVRGPENTVVVEKFRPMLRAIFPNKTERELNAISSATYMAKEDGYDLNGYKFIRRVDPSLYPNLAKHLVSTKVRHPFESEIEFFKRFEGKKAK